MSTTQISVSFVGPKDRESVAPSGRAGNRILRILARPAGPEYVVAYLRRSLTNHRIYPVLTDGAIDSRSFGPKASSALKGANSKIAT